MADTEHDKSEAATPYKLQEAQRRGQTAKSVDATVAVLMFALVCTLYALNSTFLQRELALCRALFTQAGRQDWTPDGTFNWLYAIFVHGLAIMAPLFAAIAGAAILVNFAQAGPVFSIEPVKPDWDRLNPATGFKRLFSIKLLFETGKNVVKLLVLSVVLWLTLEAAFPDLLTQLNRAPQAQMRWLSDSTAALLVKLLLVLIVVGAIDYGYVHWEFGRKMRMSKREVKDEHKQREGDPRIRSRLRELRMKFLKQTRAIRKLPGADVMITNPTHIAVALAYRHGEMAAPQLLCKGAGELAAKLREAARAHHIPIVENPPLARELYKRLDYDALVPEDLYPPVAQILVWVYAQREAKAERAAA